MFQYFTRAVAGQDDSALESVRIEDMFGACWSVPRPGPSLPTIITVQAPAGIGKSSMLKYMCMKWGCEELWSANFDVLLFIECRTLNRLGHMTGKEFLLRTLEPINVNVTYDEEDEDLFTELTRKAGAGRVLLLLDGLDEVHNVGQLAKICNPACERTKGSAANTMLSPLEFAQCLLTGALLSGCHLVVTSRPHTLSHLQSSRWFLSLAKKLVSLDIQGLSEEGVQSFIHR